MSGDTEKVKNAIADMITLSGRLKIQSEEVKCELCASHLLLESVVLKQRATDMQYKLFDDLESKCGVKFEKCEIEDYTDEKK